MKVTTVLCCPPLAIFWLALVVLWPVSHAIVLDGRCHPDDTRHCDPVPVKAVSQTEFFTPIVEEGDTPDDPSKDQPRVSAWGIAAMSVAGAVLMATVVAVQRRNKDDDPPATSSVEEEDGMGATDFPATTTPVEEEV